jgi:hypothetical protein
MYQVTGLGTNGGQAPEVEIEQAASSARRTNIMRMALASIGGAAGGMAAAYFLRPEDVGQERYKSAVKGAFIGGAVALGMTFLFQGVILGAQAVGTGA